jgi:predicted nucleic acid-binding protein
MTMRVMLDTNVFDRLLDDAEAVSELMNRRDLRLLVSPIQLSELAAVPDPERRGRLQELAATLCATLSAPAAADGDRAGSCGDRAGLAGDDGVRAESCGDRAHLRDDRHGADRITVAVAKRGCDLLVSDDLGLLEYAVSAGIRVMDWKGFQRRMVFACKRRA